MSEMITLTHPTPVSGSEHALTSFGVPSLALCSIITTIFFTPATRSMAPPIPLTIFPGIIQLAISPEPLTCIAPRMHMSMCPPRIIAKDSADEKYDAPARAVTVCLPALIKSASTASSFGNGPIPSSPFSDCNHTSIPAGM